MKIQIPFNKPFLTGNEVQYIGDIKDKYSGDGNYTRACHAWLEENTHATKCLLTTSCTHALELATLLIDIEKGDEIIMPSFTFVSTANPFALRGAKIVFVDVRPDTLNINELLIEDAITPKTKAIVPVHYAAVGAEMETIMEIAKKYNLWVIEDAAQGMNATYKGNHLGTIGHMGAISFHDTKNIHCGEGGVLLINDPSLIEKAEVLREKGTNRSKFLRGEIEKYSWVGIGSSYLPSELNAAFLLAQLEHSWEVKKRRLKLWKKYQDLLVPLEESGLIETPGISEKDHNGHIYYIKLRNINERQSMINFLGSMGIQSAFHYVPLHSSRAGLRHGNFFGEDIYTTKESERLLRLPMYYDLNESQIRAIVTKIEEFLYEYEI